MKRVFEEVNANGLKLMNRLVRSATWEGLGKPDGSLPEEVYEIYHGEGLKKWIPGNAK